MRWPQTYYSGISSRRIQRHVLWSVPDVDSHAEIIHEYEGTLIQIIAKLKAFFGSLQFQAKHVPV